MCAHLMKCAAGDIPRLTRLKKHGSELKFFVSIFGKLSQINNIKSRKMATFENCETFSNCYFSYVRDYKATLSGAINYFPYKHNRHFLEIFGYGGMHLKTDYFMLCDLWWMVRRWVDVKPFIVRFLVWTIITIQEIF